MLQLHLLMLQHGGWSKRSNQLKALPGSRSLSAPSAVSSPWLGVRLGRLRELIVSEAIKKKNKKEKQNKQMEYLIKIEYPIVTWQTHKANCTIAKNWELILNELAQE